MRRPAGGGDASCARRTADLCPATAVEESAKAAAATGKPAKYDRKERNRTSGLIAPSEAQNGYHTSTILYVEKEIYIKNY